MELRKRTKFFTKFLLVALIAGAFLQTGLVQEVGASSPSSSSSLDVSIVKTEPVPMMKGEYADVWVEVRNRGNRVAEDVELELVPEYPFDVDPDKDLTRDFGKIEVGDEYQAKFTVRVDDNAVSGENSLKFRTRSSIATITKELPVDIRTREAVLAVEEVNVEDGLIAPSMTKDVELKIRNLATSYMRNIDVSLELGGTSSEVGDFGEVETDEIPLITAGRTTEKRISNIAPGETESVVFPVKADADADERAYKVPIGLSYEDEMGNSFEKSEFTGIIVGGEPQIESGLSNIDDYPVAGNMRDVSLRLVNRGLSKAKFLEMELGEDESFEVVGSSDVYVGDMDPDDFDSSSFDIFIEEGVETVSIPIYLEYRDSEGNVLEDEQVVEFRTYTEEELDRLGLLDEGGGIIGVVVFVLIVVGGVYFYKKRKKKTKSILDE